MPDPPAAPSPLARGIRRGIEVGWIYAVVEGFFASVLPVARLHGSDRPMHVAFTALLFLLYPLVGAAVGAVTGALLGRSRPAGPQAWRAEAIVGLTTIGGLALACTVNVVLHGELNRSTLGIATIGAGIVVVRAAMCFQEGVASRLDRLLGPWSVSFMLVGLAWLQLGSTNVAGALDPRLLLAGWVAAVGLIALAAQILLGGSGGPRPERGGPSAALAAVGLLVLLAGFVLGRAPEVVIDDLRHHTAHPQPWTLRSAFGSARAIVPERQLWRRGERRTWEYAPVELVSSTSPGDAGSTVRLLDRPFSERSDGVRKVSTERDGQRRNAVEGQGTHRFTFELDVAPGARLAFAVDRDRPGWSRAATRFTTTIARGDARSVAHETVIEAGELGWREARIDLSAWAGERITLEFEAETDANDSTAYWSELFVASDGEAARPDIVLLLVDTLRPDHLGAYGYERPTSPVIDDLAAGGAVFTRAFSVAPWTDPSILGLHTGFYPSDLWEARPHSEAISVRLPPDVDTLAEHLAANGYFTVAVSDHPGINPGRFGQGFDIFLRPMRSGFASGGWVETPITDVLRGIDSVVRDRPRHGLFAYVHVLYPHLPNDLPDAYAGLFGPWTTVNEEENRQEVINAYDAEVRRSDDFVAALRGLLDATGHAEGSVFLLVADHGEGFWEHGSHEHGRTLYNELLRIPLIVNAPGRVEAGARVDGVVQIVDVMPTLVDLAGLPVPSETRGRSLLPLLAGERDDARVAYSEFPHSRIIEGRALQDRDRKLIVEAPEEAPMLYDLEADPGELEDLRAAAPALATALRTQLEGITDRARARRETYEHAEEAPSEDLIRQLEALGYTE